MRTFRTNKIEFDSVKKIVETDTEIIVPTIFTRESILPFEDGRGYRSAEQLKKYGWTLEDAWLVVYDHIPTVFPTDPDQVKGKVKNVKFDSQINGLVGESCFSKSLCDQPFQEAVRKGNLKDVSVAYFSEDVMMPGKFGDEPYDFVQTKFFFGHLAAGVSEGRCPSPYCGMTVDSLLAKVHKDPEETKDFIHIPVRDSGLFVEGKFRTIDIDVGKGIKAVIGKLKSDPTGSTVVQKFIFDKSEDWTMEKAQAWVKEHKDSIKCFDEGQPKTEKERFMAHFGIDEKAFQKLYDLLGDELLKLLPERGEKVKDSAFAMSLEEIRQKLKDLEKQRLEIMEKLYPKTQLSEEEQQKFRGELTVLDAEMKAFTQFLTEKVSENIEAAADSTEKFDEKPDPHEELARSRRYFHSNMSLFEGTE